jgi:hypothetical protein
MRLLETVRSHAHFSDYADRDPRAAWTSWDKLRKALRNVKTGTIKQLLAFCARNEREQRAALRPESFAIPVGGLGVIANPTREFDGVK